MKTSCQKAGLTGGVRGDLALFQGGIRQRGHLYVDKS